MLNTLIVICYHRFRNPFHPLIIANCDEHLYRVFKSLKTVIRLIETDKQKYNVTNEFIKYFAL